VVDHDSAQLAKMELIARKLKLEPGMQVVDLGCGYGTLAHYLARNYKVSVVGVTVSKDQMKYAEILCEGLPCKFYLSDYRGGAGLGGSGWYLERYFDRVISIEMIEHVGRSNYKEFFTLCRRILKDDGIFLAQCVGIAHNSIDGFDQFSHKYIFPNSYLPYYMEICKAIEGLWIIEDWHNFGYDFYKTLLAWEENFDKVWPSLKELYGSKFHIIWKIYLQSGQAGFATRSFQVWQMVLSKDGIKTGYLSVR